MWGYIATIPAVLWRLHLHQCAATLECYSADRGHAIPPRRCIQTHWVRSDREILLQPSKPHTHIELYNIVMVVVSQTLARKCTVPVSYPRTQCFNRNAQDYPEGSAWTQRSGRRDLRVPLSWEFRFILYDVRYFVSNTVLMLRIKHILVYVNLQL